MTKIPDDVVERLWCDLCEKSDRTSPSEHPDMALITLDELRAAGRVFVEWERKQCIRAFKNAWDGESEDAEFYADAIRARSAPEKE